MNRVTNESLDKPLATDFHVFLVEGRSEPVSAH